MNSITCHLCKSADKVLEYTCDGPICRTCSDILPADINVRPLRCLTCKRNISPLFQKNELLFCNDCLL